MNIPAICIFAALSAPCLVSGAAQNLAALARGLVSRKT